MFKKQIWIAIKTLLVLSMITGIIYPLFITVVAQLIYPSQANGSLIEKNGTKVGSQLIGQWFTEEKYFWPRLSATGSYPYNARASGGSNYGPSNPKLTAQVESRIFALEGTFCKDSPPVDLVTASASGLDPDISVSAANCQVGRVAKARGLSLAQVEQLVGTYTKGREFGFLGEPPG